MQPFHRTPFQVRQRCRPWTKTVLQDFSAPPSTGLSSKILRMSQMDKLLADIELLKRLNSRAAANPLLGTAWGPSRDPDRCRAHSRRPWALDPHALSLGLVTVLRRWTCSLLCPVCTSQMYRYGSIHSHPPTCQGRAAWTCTFPWRDLHETQFACVVHASHAIPRSNHSGRLRSPSPSPSGGLSARPSLGLPACPACDSGSARQIQIWHGPGHIRRGSGEGWMSPCRRLVDRCCKAHGCPRPWDRLADGRLLCRCNVTSIL